MNSTLLYLKFVILWALVILADFILEFRFEFLWPFYLLLRSVYDSFKYQGLAFSIFFVCIALTSDMLCFFFIPVHWLFFAASTYVWVQYVWHTDRGICAPTIILWILFVYLEAAVRLRDIKHMPGHLDLCRPFAAHCIGYPVVTLGFGFKSYVGYRMRQRKQQVVAKENQFYMQLMQQALPVETTPPIEQTEAPANAIVPAQPVQNNNKIHSNRQSHEKNGHIPNGTIANGVHNTHGTKSHHRKSVDKCKDHGDQHDHKHTERHIDKQKVSHSHSNGSAIGAGMEDTAPQEPEPKPTRKREKKEQDKEREAAEYLQRLETDAKKLRTDLQSSRASEQELRLQVASLTTTEKVSKGELSAMQREIEELQQRLQSALSTKSLDKQSISNLERRLVEERRLRSNIESQLSQERKNRKEDARAAQVAAQQSSRGECTEACKSRRRELEAELADMRSAKHWQEERLQALERENAAFVEQLRDTDILMSALSAMQEKNSHLENSLSAENRIKLDLFSALGEAKRQLELKENANRAQEKEIEELKGKIAQVLAVMPNDTFGGPTSSSNISRVRLAESPPSNLDPNATAYTPKSSLIASTEA
ncbi:macoilin isoform X2 [Anoplophora glabripennis]|uniref:macoilin isoform X2 n=1 Tax=Anoplophora glabripennis TaxID=217634 RepID=UPI0008736E31|nr:macoilin isoform X2 [Anoplophora glabripennis]